MSVSTDKSFIVILRAIEEHAAKEMAAHDPSAQSHTIDGYLQGRLSMIKEVIREYINE